MRVARFDQHLPSKETRDRFDCGEPALNRWLATQARQSMESRYAVTYLLVDDEAAGDETDAIAGYYCLSSGQVSREAAPTGMARRAPQPIPAVRMGRFAIDRGYQRQGWGADLLGDALLRAVSAGKLVAARVMLVDAMNDAARLFGSEAIS